MTAHPSQDASFLVVNTFQDGFSEFYYINKYNANTRRKLIKKMIKK